MGMMVGELLKGEEEEETHKLLGVAGYMVFVVVVLM
jgi:hypothetical protein